MTRSKQLWKIRSRHRGFELGKRTPATKSPKTGGKALGGE